MIRYDPHALIEFLESRSRWAFGYGREPETHDCARFCDAGVDAVFGFRPLKAFASHWTSHSGARRVLAQHGGMAQAVGEVMDPISVTLARRGEVGMVEGGQLVLFEGDTVVGPAPERGLYRLPRSAAVLAWTVRQ